MNTSPAPKNPAAQVPKVDEGLLIVPFLEGHRVDRLCGAVGHNHCAPRAVRSASPALPLLHRQHGRPLHSIKHAEVTDSGKHAQVDAASPLRSKRSRLERSSNCHYGPRCTLTTLLILCPFTPSTADTVDILSSS